MHRTGTLFLLLIGLLMGSCSLFYAADEELWVHEVLQNGPPLRDLLSDCEWAMIEANFPPGDRDDAGARVTSGWQTVAHPFGKYGRRYQGILEIEPLDEIGVYRVSARVRVQINEEIHKTLDMAEAKWESGTDDRVRARTLLYHLMGRVSKPGLSDDFYRRKPWRKSSTEN
jgi:hypothetical protein